MIIIDMMISCMISKNKQFIYEYHVMFCSMFVGITAPMNFAYLKPTSQSSTLVGNYFSFLANDGNLSQKGTGFCSHTQLDHDPWWQVDLLRPIEVTHLFVLNRWDCCIDILHNFEVRIGNNSEDGGKNNARCGDSHSLKNIKNLTIYCTPSITGRFVSIIKRRVDALSLCEVAVYGAPGKVFHIVV